MADKAFNKKLSHRCEYCVNSKALDGSNEVICKKRGVVDRQDSCRHYKYDPLKRVPDTAKISKNYTPEDFSL